MSTRSVMTACAGMLLVLVSSFAIRADEKTLLIELESRSEALPTGLSASGAVVSGACEKASRRPDSATTSIRRWPRPR